MASNAVHLRGELRWKFIVRNKRKWTRKDYNGTRDPTTENKLDVNEIEKMKIKELREQLSKLHLSTTEIMKEIKTIYKE